MFSNTPPPRTSLFFPPVSGAWDCQRPGITNKDQGKGSTWVPWLPCFPFPCHGLPFPTQQQVQRCYFCCWYTYSSPSCCSLCISPDSSVGFPDTITTYLDSLCIPPCHLSVVPSLVLHFHVWVLSEVPSSSIQASCYLCMISHWSGWPNPELAGDYSWKLTNSPGSLFLPGSSSLWFIQAGTWRGQSVLLKPRVVILLLSSGSWVSPHGNSNQGCPRTPDLTSLFERSSGTSFFIGSLITCVRNCFHPCRNLLDCLYTFKRYQGG